MPRLLAVLCLVAALFAPAARGDEVAEAQNSVVRVALIGSSYGGGQVLLSTGSGFAVEPDLIVTNAHVVEAAIRYQGNVAVAIVPPDSRGPIEGRVVDYDLQRDLALVRLSGARLTPLALSLNPPRQGDDTAALGYPDIDDLQRPARELIRPTAPSRSQGKIASLRDRAPTGQAIPTINHDAAISSGSSGGPLLDLCGRVMGVNTWHARGQQTFQGRGVATQTSELMQFLVERGIEPATRQDRCLSEAERVAQRLAEAEQALEERNRTPARSERDGADEAQEAFWANLPLVILIGALAIAVGLIALAIALLARRRSHGGGRRPPPPPRAPPRR